MSMLMHWSVLTSQQPHLVLSWPRLPVCTAYIPGTLSHVHDQQEGLCASNALFFCGGSTLSTRSERAKLEAVAAFCFTVHGESMVISKRLVAAEMHTRTQQIEAAAELLSLQVHLSAHLGTVVPMPHITATPLCCGSPFQCYALPLDGAPAALWVFVCLYCPAGGAIAGTDKRPHSSRPYGLHCSCFQAPP